MTASIANCLIKRPTSTVTIPITVRMVTIDHSRDRGAGIAGGEGREQRSQKATSRHAKVFRAFGTSIATDLHQTKNRGKYTKCSRIDLRSKYKRRLALCPRCMESEAIGP